MDGLDKLTTEERFELLSAYMDDELSVSERQQVEHWLETDPEMQQRYNALSALSLSFQSLPAPETNTDQLLDAVFTEVERKPRQLKKVGTIAAIIAAVGALGAVISNNTLTPRLADSSSEITGSEASVNTVLSTDILAGDIESIDTDSLMLVLEAPPVEIPVVENASFSTTVGE